MKSWAVALLLILACSMASAQEEFLVEFPISMSREIGNTSYAYSVPYAYEDNIRIGMEHNEMKDGNIAYEFSAGSTQVWNRATMTFISLSYFLSGKPSSAIEKSAFLDSFRAARGKVDGEGIDTTVAGYNATLWNAQTPFIDALGLPAYFPALLAYVDIDSHRSMAIMAEAPVFASINQSLVVWAVAIDELGGSTENGAPIF